jgi:N-acyl-D-aspartate/D-glutamate deacylase
MRSPLWFASLAAALAAVPAVAAPARFDVLIRGGRVVDGTGNPSFMGDVAIKNGRIAAVGKLTDATAARTIDARDRVVAPGFIDIHSHADPSLLIDGGAYSAVYQGITSVILGEGPSMAPSKQFPTFSDYFGKLMKQGISINAGSYVGSSQIWTEVHGARAGPPTRDELARMQALVRQMMLDGALGVSSSLSGPPGSWIDTDTLVAMCQAAAPLGGVFSTHMRHEGLEVWAAVDEALAIGKRAGVPVDIIHLKISEHTLWGQMPKLIARIAAARAAGADVQANVYPYWAGQNDLATIVPPWAHEGGREALIARLKDPAQRQRIQKEITTGIPGWYDHYTATGSWQGMLLASLSNPAYKPFEGKRMSELIAARGPDRPFEVFFQTLIDNGGSVPTVYFHHAEKDMVYALQQPFVSVGSDGGALKTEGPLRAGNPHPRFYGTFPRVLGRYVREQKALTLEEAVRKMTSANSARVHVFDRGLLRPGQWADVTVFDPATIADKATFENPHQYAVGVSQVLVNGELVLDQGRHTGARPGRIIPGPGKQTAPKPGTREKS